MNYEIKISESGKFVIAKIFANMTQELMMEVAPKADEIGREHNILNLLIDLRESSNVDSIRANIQFTDQVLPDPKKAYFKKIAALVRPKDNTHSLIIVIMRNKGFNIQMYRDEREALDWLDDKTN